MKRKLLSARLERHIERGEQLMELNRAAFDRNAEAFDRNARAFDRNAEAFDRNARAFDRNTAAFKSNAAAFERNTEAFERMMSALDRFEENWDQREARFNERLDENAQFMREMNLRAEKVVQEMVRRNDEVHARAERQTNAIVVEVKEFREESKAHREALLALIDRLPPAATA